MEELDNSFANYSTWRIKDFDVFMYDRHNPIVYQGQWLDAEWNHPKGKVSELLEKVEFELISSALDSILKEFKYISEDIQGHPYFQNEHRHEVEDRRYDVLVPFQIITELRYEDDKPLLKVNFISFGEGSSNYVKEFKSSDCPEDIEKALREILLFIYDYIGRSLLKEEEEC